MCVIMTQLLWLHLSELVEAILMKAACGGKNDYERETRRIQEVGEKTKSKWVDVFTLIFVIKCTGRQVIRRINVISSCIPLAISFILYSKSSDWVGNEIENFHK